MPWQSFFNVCEMVTGSIAQSFIGVVHEGRVPYWCFRGRGRVNIGIITGVCIMGVRGG